MLFYYWNNLLFFKIEFETDILYKDFLGEDTYPVPLLELYSSFDEYEQITLPWLFVSKKQYFTYIKILVLFFFSSKIKRSVKLNDHKLAGIEFDAVLPQIRLLKSGLYEFKAQILQKRTANQRREMFNEDDLVLITLTNQSANKIFGLIRSGERITDKARLHKSYRRSKNLLFFSNTFFFSSLDDHPDVKITPPVWFCYEYNILIFGNGMKILDGSKIKIKVTKI